MPPALDARLLKILRTEGPQSHGSLLARLEKSQSTLFRWAQAHPETLIALGAPKTRTLAALRNVRNLGSHFPVFKVSEQGEVSTIGELVALYPTQSALIFKSSPTKSHFYPGLPSFMDDVRPQGFLGKSFGQKHTDLRLPARITDWNHDDSLEAITRRGEDLVGDLIFGNESFERFQLQRNTAVKVIHPTNAGKHYIQNAEAAMEGHPTGSSAGGEQPKFSEVLTEHNGNSLRVLVKFSPSGEGFSAERWRDLLICESIALNLLQENGIAAARNRLIEEGGRTFLETERFDRIGLHGRRGLLSLLALENEYVGRSSNWAASAEALHHLKKVSSEDLKTIRFLESFGRLIGNSDRHSGNLSFHWNAGEPQVTLASIYDMLPMMYAPINGEDSCKGFTYPIYEHTLLEVWKDALTLAVNYWERITEDARVSEEFKGVAVRHLKTLRH